MGRLRDFLHSAKDAGVSIVAERYAARFLEPYGRMLNLSIDSRAKKITVELLPKGEQTPITVTIDEYELITLNQQTSILIKRASANREWVDALLKDFATGESIKLPEQYANTLAKIL